MQNQNQKVLLSSGGMDSFLLAHERELQGAVHVFVNIRQKYLDKEYKAAKIVAKNAGAILHTVETLNMGVYEHSTGIIPFRNAELILCAAQYGNQIYLGVIADEINSDKSVEFCTAIQNVLNISHKKQYWTNGKQFEIKTPFRNFSKSQLVYRYMLNGGNMGNLLQSVSCYDASANHCGQCASCFKRWVALTNYETQNKWQQWGFVKNPLEWQPRSYWQQKTDYGYERYQEIQNAFIFSEVV
jgi:7-cyano-7-deazaguanine synthase